MLSLNTCYVTFNNAVLKTKRNNDTSLNMTEIVEWNTKTSRTIFSNSLTFNHAVLETKRNNDTSIQSLNMTEIVEWDTKTSRTIFSIQLEVLT